ncbi:methyltransferase domain-containing protein [Fluoribacter gormanii]|uniref:Methyltransferase domain-containing protein n=1 Tax=Fluoribacter gormanii TaxID=464 RepID=A0A377GJ66_9GAMM|nr:methyltransferase [Fluoribacter gormanii]KTD01354.1 methyltransferase [Fluoribacter gormanii]MCW8472044.1 methyltransferase domain-containing protein [Fluoribacter gormanii]SIR48434.1 Methyltransferase domain-containing protein [Fluoribacter gormanii]STO24836.1 Trans-aconitate methyltransferase [Fluoribacter gormanii]
MAKLKVRSKEKEIIDLGQDFYTPQEYEQSLKKLFKINRMMGIFKSTVNLLRQFPSNSVLTDVGCGGGLFLLHLAKYFPGMRMFGLDISQDAIKLAEEELHNWQQKNGCTQIKFQIQLKPELEIKTSVDIILLNLVCHHLNDEELVSLLIKANDTALKAVIINDLHRNFIAYWLYKIISPVLFRNRLITHDGLLSIQKSFTRTELDFFLQQAGIKNYKIKWHFPFWWSILILK